MGEDRLLGGHHPVMVRYTMDRRTYLLGAEMDRGQQMSIDISTPKVFSFINPTACMLLESMLCVSGFGWRVTRALSCVVYKHGSNIWNVSLNTLK